MSKTLKFFATTYLFTLFTLSVAMQDVDIDIQEMENLKNHFAVHYISNNVIAMNSIINFSIFNATKGKSKYIPGPPMPELPQLGNIMIQSNDDNIVLASGQNYMVFNRKNGDHTWFECLHKITSLKIGSSNKFWFTGDRSNYLLTCDCDSAEVKSFFGKTICNRLECRRVLDVDENKKKIYIEDHYGDFAKHELEDYQECKTIKIPEVVYSRAGTLKHQLSSDKSYLACGNGLCIYKAVIDKSLSCEPFIKSAADTQFKQMLFLPQKNILATVSQISGTKSVLQYWDFEQTEAHEPIYSFELNAVGCRDISFAPNGTEGMIAFREKCIRVSVPF